MHGPHWLKLQHKSILTLGNASLALVQFVLKRVNNLSCIVVVRHNKLAAKTIEFAL